MKFVDMTIWTMYKQSWKRLPPWGWRPQTGHQSPWKLRETALRGTELREFFFGCPVHPKMVIWCNFKVKNNHAHFFCKVNNPKRKMTIKHLNPCYPLDRSPGATIAFTTSLWWTRPDLRGKVSKSQEFWRWGWLKLSMKHRVLQGWGLIYQLFWWGHEIVYQAFDPFSS